MRRLGNPKYLTLGGENAGDCGFYGVCQEVFGIDSSWNLFCFMVGGWRQMFERGTESCRGSYYSDMFTDEHMAREIQRVLNENGN